MRASTIHVTGPLAANPRPRHRTPFSTVPPMSVRAHASYTPPRTGRPRAHQASAPCPPACSPKAHIPGQPIPSEASPGFDAVLTFSTSRVMLPLWLARSTSASASLVCSILGPSIVVLPFTNGSSAAVQAAASLLLTFRFAASTWATESTSGRGGATSAASWGDLRRDGGSRIR